MPVRLVQGIGNGDRYLQRFFQFERTALEPLCKGFTFEVLRYNVIHAIMLCEIDKRTDVGVFQGCDRLRHALQALFPFRVFGKLRWK
jgi:hypothetical protein